MKPAYLLTAAAFILLLPPCTLSARDVRPSDAEVRQQIIAQSIASYPGNCPCPYNTARNGSRCGGRSARRKGTALLPGGCDRRDGQGAEG